MEIKSILYARVFHIDGESQTWETNGDAMWCADNLSHKLSNLFVYLVSYYIYLIIKCDMNTTVKQTIEMFVFWERKELERKELERKELERKESKDVQTGLIKNKGEID